MLRRTVISTVAPYTRPGLTLSRTATFSRCYATSSASPSFNSSAASATEPYLPQWKSASGSPNYSDDGSLPLADQNIITQQSSFSPLEFASAQPLPTLNEQLPTDSPIAQQPESLTPELHDQVLDNALKYVPHYGWTVEAISQGAIEAGYSASTHTMFSKGPIELVEHFLDKVDRQFEEKVRDMDAHLGALSTNQRLVALMQARLELFAPYIHNWQQGVGLLVFSADIGRTASRVFNVADKINSMAGETDSNIDLYARKFAIAGVYIASEMYMLTDTSHDFNDTWTFLANRWEDAANLNLLKNETGNIGNLMQQLVSNGLAIMARYSPVSPQTASNAAGIATNTAVEMGRIATGAAASAVRDPLGTAVKVASSLPRDPVSAVVDVASTLGNALPKEVQSAASNILSSLPREPLTTAIGVASNLASNAAAAFSGHQQQAQRQPESGNLSFASAPASTNEPYSTYDGYKSNSSTASSNPMSFGNFGSAAAGANGAYPDFSHSQQGSTSSDSFSNLQPPPPSTQQPLSGTASVSDAFPTIVDYSAVSPPPSAPTSSDKPALSWVTTTAETTSNDTQQQKQQTSVNNNSHNNKGNNKKHKDHKKY